MQLPPIFAQKKNILIEVAVLIVFLGILYYVYTAFSQDQTTTTTTTINQQLLGQNFVLLLKAVNQDKLSLQDIPVIMNSKLVPQLQDFSEVIPRTTVRGRLDPFVPYAFTRPIR
jgi:ABC-type maltose transport system permease subunit